MGHNARIRIDANWALGTVWTSGERSAFDASFLAAVNGDGGGAWTPTSNFGIGGAGLRLIGRGTTHTLAGGVATTDGAANLLVHGDSDYCVLGSGHTGVTQTLCTPVGDGQSPIAWAPAIQLISGANPQVTTGPVIGVMAPSLGATYRVPLRVHDGGTFSTIAFPWTVNTNGAPGNYNSIPTQMPRFRVCARDSFGKVAPLSVTSPFQSPPTPASTNAFYNGGFVQTFSYACDAVGANPYVLVDAARYTYFAEIVEVSGYPAAGVIIYGDLLSTFTNITDLRPR